jgi:inosose dehydratase
MAHGTLTGPEIAARHGLTASYDPHLATMVEGPDQIADILSRSRISFCPDTAHLAAGGGDPVERSAGLQIA